ncbi:MAG TPA: GNAT family N-acetyltransferase [Gemmatimonadaceae bacterium]|nr:GNAT family N-acetyltransferase [Gemmatimonadaceae bacterium]
MLRVERAVLGDIDAIVKLSRETWLDTYGAWYSDSATERLLAVWLEPTGLTVAIQDPLGFVAVARAESGEIVGVLSARLANAGRVPKIHRLYVLPSRQRQGVGTALLRAFVAECSTAESVCLEVQVGNQKGLTFWLRQGFFETGVEERSVAGETIRVIEMARKL